MTLFSFMINGISINVTVDAVVMILLAIVLVRFVRKKITKIISGIVFALIILARIFGVFEMLFPNLFTPQNLQSVGSNINQFLTLF